MKDFTLDFRISESAEEQKISSKIVCKSQMATHELELLDNMFEAFVRACNNGMFCGSSIIPSESAMKTLDRRTMDDLSREWRFMMKSIDPGAFRILLGLFRYFSYYTKAIHSLSLVSMAVTPGTLIPMTKIAEGEIPYPKPYRELRFNILRHTPARLNKYRLVQIEFLQIPNHDSIDVILKAIEDWDVLLRGGFPVDGNQPWESGISPGEVYFIDDYTVEHSIYYFGGSEEAFNALINLSGKFDLTCCPVREVRIY